MYAADLDVTSLVDEPSAAAKVLRITDGAVVDIGGGTTGISVIHDGSRCIPPTKRPEARTSIWCWQVITKWTFKRPNESKPIRCVSGDSPLVTPVFQKMAIVKEHLRGQFVDTLYLVGGTSCFPGIECVMEQETDIPVARPSNPFLVTPLGIALACAETA